MAYKPSEKTKEILDQAFYWTTTVPYDVTARWLFYRLLQDGTYSEKKGYKHLLGITSKARKQFYDPWRPWTLADDTRAPVLMQRIGYYGLHLRGDGFKDADAWLDKLKDELNCPLNRWESQPVYAEVYFEAHAMQGQFLYYANENLPLLAFGGDVSISPKWKTAERLAEKYIKFKKPIHIYYFGDYDLKGITIPQSAWRDIGSWAGALIINQGIKPEKLNEILNYHRVGINPDHITRFSLPENPERPGSYQWEALSDNQAAELIAEANDLLNLDAFAKVEQQEDEITERLKSQISKYSTKNT